MSDPFAATPPTIRVATYNVLAQCLSSSRYFKHAVGGVLKAKRRLPTLFARVAGLEADIVCCQEVDMAAELADQVSALTGHRYDGVLVPRPEKKDGTMVLWRADKFRCVAKRRVSFNDLADAADASRAGVPGRAASSSSTGEPGDGGVDGGGDGDDKPPGAGFLLRRKNVGLLLHLTRRVTLTGSTDTGAAEGTSSGRSKEAHDEHVIVATAHLFYDPKFAWVKQAQIKQFRAELAAFCIERAAIVKCSATQLPIVLTGDTNSLPGSEVHGELLSPLEMRGLASADGAVARRTTAGGESPPKRLKDEAGVAAPNGASSSGAGAGAAATSARDDSGESAGFYFDHADDVDAGDDGVGGSSRVMRLDAPEATDAPPMSPERLSTLQRILASVGVDLAGGARDAEGATDGAHGVEGVVEASAESAAAAPAAGDGSVWFVSAMATAAGGKEPLFTTYVPWFNGTIDYLMVSEHWAVRGVAPLPREPADVEPFAGGLPNAAEPSDHLPLWADLEVAR